MQWIKRYKYTIKFKKRSEVEPFYEKLYIIYYRVCVTVIKYQVDVYTGDVWGGGTDANIYITLYGDRGDTGVRQLYAETKGVYFKQGQVGRFLFHHNLLIF